MRGEGRGRGADGIEGGGELAHRHQPAFRAVEIGTTFFSSAFLLSSAFLPAIGSSISPCPGTLGLAFFAFGAFSAGGGVLGAFASFPAFNSRSDSARLCRKASNKLTTLRVGATAFTVAVGSPPFFLSS